LKSIGDNIQRNRIAGKKIYMQIAEEKEVKKSGMICISMPSLF